MKGWCVSWLGLVVLVGLLSAGLAQAQSSAQVPTQVPIRVQDDRGTVVTLAHAPMRIVTLLPSLTEAVCALGACRRVVATDRWSNWPAPVRALPKLGGLDDVNVELVVAQRPDLVLVAPSSRVAARLRGLGLTVAELDAQDLPQVQRLFDKVAALIGTPQAAAPLWASLQAEIEVARAQVPNAARGARVYFEVGATPYAAGEASFIGQLLIRLGVTNIVPASMGPFPQLNPEFVVRANPDLIMIGFDEANALPARPGWSTMRAVKEARAGRVCALTLSDYDLLARPGPRLGLAARVLARCLTRYAEAVQPNSSVAKRSGEKR